MAQPLTVALPQRYVLDDTYQLRITAVDPTTGALVSGVTVGRVVLMVDDASGLGLAGGTLGPFLLVPGAGA